MAKFNVSESTQAPFVTLFHLFPPNFCFAPARKVSAPQTNFDAQFFRPHLKFKADVTFWC